MIKKSCKRVLKAIFRKNILSKKKLRTFFLLYSFILLYYYLQQLWEVQLSDNSFHFQTP